VSDQTVPSTGFPSPAEFPEFWQMCSLGPFLLPPDLKQGTCFVKVSPGIEIDRKKPKGKDKSKKTVQGKTDAKVTVVMTFSSAIWSQVQPIIEALQPNGTPVDIAHPNTMIHGVSAVMIVSVPDGVQWDGGKGTYTWECEEWEAPSSELGTTPYLKLGSTGPEVSRWQAFLNGDETNGGVLAGLEVSGNFDAATDAATRTFQAREAITVDGPQTFGAASRYGYVPPALQKGTAGSGAKTPTQAEPTDIDNPMLVPTGDVAQGDINDPDLGLDGVADP
jgi:hypothetical protein